MTDHSQLSAGGFLFQASRDGVEDFFVRRRKGGFVELEVNIADDNGFFLNHDHLFDHRCRYRRRATIGVDLHAFRRTRALVAAVGHTIAVFIRVTVNPAIGRCRTADQQGAITCP